MALPSKLGLNSANGILNYFNETKNEMKNVTWPTRAQLIAYTLVVFVAVLFVAALIWGIDSFFNVIFRWFLNV